MSMLQGAAFRMLGCFLDKDERNFAELCKEVGYPTDLGGYYIRQLTTGGYLEKVKRGTYAILPKGKQALAHRYGKSLAAPKPRLVVILVARQKDTFVAVRRKVQPFLGVAEWPAGEVLMGERLDDAVRRVTDMRFACTGQAELAGFFRRTDLYGDMVFDDKLFAVYNVVLPDDATLPTENKAREVLRCTEQELLELSRPAKSLLDIFRFAKQGAIFVEEHRYELSLEDLFQPE
jgi:ADP-ribose pyrophosphatase YjhB (NUDIX family)